MTQTELIEKIRKCLKTNAREIEDSDIIAAMDESLNIISKECPLIKSAVLTRIVDSSYIFPTDWDSDFSFIQGIEFDTDGLLSYPEQTEYKIHYENNLPELELLNNESLPENIILHYSIKYNITSEGCNMKAGVISAFIKLVCSQLLLMLAQKYSFLFDSGFESDINLSEKSKQLLEISDKYKKLYDELVEQILFGSQVSRACLSTKCHSSDIFGGNKLFH